LSEYGIETKRPAGIQKKYWQPGTNHDFLLTSRCKMFTEGLSVLAQIEEK
jgi:hypothetical protein